MGRSWKETKLWLALEQRSEAADTRLTLQNCLPKIELVLASGGTAGLDFTLHDQNHSYRVAERMAELIGAERLNELSSIEVALLLLSAYLHDIGMTPSRERAKRHWQYILTGDRKLLDTAEARELQRWLDGAWDGIEPPLNTGTLTPSGLELAEEVYVYYCRHKHNDWSESWIRENLEATDPYLYSGWIEDVVDLCRSHHEGLAELRLRRFNARIVGIPGSVVNLRYLAALLRVADVIEFDPERTPDVILKHRGIVPSSRIYWHKDHPIGFHLEEDGSRILFSARTPNAVIHKAVLSTAEWVNHELACCSALQHEGAYKRGTIPEKQRAAYQWQWPARLTLDVTEKDESFVYIDGAFRPNTKKILKLLSGTALYHNSFAAVRELIQNAVDAVREQIAYERLQQPEPADVLLEQSLGRLHRVRLSFETDGENYWLHCSDDGVGMTKEIVEKHLLVSGSETRPELRALERDAQANGFSVGRTGQFGIGVLSYFMIADRVEITTRRSSDAGDTDSTAWHFVTEGIGSFGELTRTSRASKGTEVRLRLRADVLGDDPDKWFQELTKFLKKTLRWIPCTFELRNEVVSGAAWHLEPGWCGTADELSEKLLSNLASISPKSSLVTAEEQAEYDRLDQRLSLIKAKAKRTLRWLGPQEVDLPGQAGKARFWLPYFEFAGGVSLAFVDIDDNHVSRVPDDKDVVIPSGATLSSWKGFVANLAPARSKDTEIGVVEIDFRSGGDISVNRNHISVDQPGDLIRFMQEHMTKLARGLLSKNAKSEFAILNALVCSRLARSTFQVAAPKGAKWRQYLKGSSTNWKPLKLPAAEILCASYDSGGTETELLWCDQKVGSLQKLRVKAGAWLSPSRGIKGGRVILRTGPGGRHTPTVLWAASQDTTTPIGTRPWVAKFPPDWSELMAIVTPYRPFWNSDHPLIKHIAQARPMGRKHENIVDEIKAVSSNKIDSINFVLSRLDSEARFWTALKENYQELYELLLLIAGVENNNPILLWSFNGHFDSDITVKIGRNGGEAVISACSKSGLKIPGGLLPWPKEKEWWAHSIDAAWSSTR